MADVILHHPEPLGEDNYVVPEDEAAHLVATINRAYWFASGDRVSAVHVYLGKRTEPKYHKDSEGNEVCHDEGGWLEHHIRAEWKGGGGMSIGAIQRKPGEKSEFHS